MLKAITEVVGSKLVDLDKSQTIGEVTNWVINPSTKRLSALVVKLTGWWSKTMVVTTADIIEYGPRIVVIKNQAAAVAPDEVAGMPQLLRSRHRLIGAQVETQSGRIVGRVEDVFFETTDSSLQKIYVKPQLLGLMSRPDIIITIDKVIEITPRRLVVRDDVDEPLTHSQAIPAKT